MATIITLLLVGAALVVLETLLPGLVAGTVGLGCLAAAVYFGYNDFGMATGNTVLTIVVGGCVMGMFIYVKWFPDSRVAARFVSRGKIGLQDNEQLDLLEATGTAITTLRPSGTALINDRRVDVVTEGEMVEKGTPLKVVAIEGLRVVVRPQARELRPEPDLNYEYNPHALLAAANLPGGNTLTTVLYGIGLLILLVIAILVLNFGMIWIRALFSGAKVTFTELIALRLRNVPVGLVVDTRITAIKSGLDLSIDDLSTHYLAGGTIEMVVQALIAAQKAGIRLLFDRACAIDLATKGTAKTVLEAVKTSVNPKVIDCPDPTAGKATVDAVAKDGIVIKAKARVTVRTNLDRFVGGATEETIIARVGEGIVTTIGSAASYKDVLENPDRISKNVLDKALDSNTAFEILSIDIADVDVGDNVGAKLQAEQAEANKLIAQAQAEVRRAAAVALEQEMVARVAEMRARVVEAEAQVPLAMADAFRSGHLGVMDYYRMKNIVADTSMRESIGGAEDGPSDGSSKG